MNSIAIYDKVTRLIDSLSMQSVDCLVLDGPRIFYIYTQVFEQNVHFVITFQCNSNDVIHHLRATFCENFTQFLINDDTRT